MSKSAYRLPQIPFYQGFFTNQKLPRFSAQALLQHFSKFQKCPLLGSENKIAEVWDISFKNGPS